MPTTRPSSAITQPIAVWRSAPSPVAFDATTTESTSCLPTHATAVGNTPDSRLTSASPIVSALFVAHTRWIARLLYLKTPK